MSDDFSADTSTTGRLLIDIPSNGFLEYRYGESDWFKISLQADTSYIFNLSWRQYYYGYATSVVLAVRDATGKVVSDGSGVSGDNRPFLQFNAASSGDYFLSVSGYDHILSYTVHAAVQAPDPIASSIATSAAIVVGNNVEARFDVAGDRDWFRFDAEPGQHIAFGSLAATDTTVQAAGLYIHDANGVRVTGATASVFEPLVAGTYYVSAESLKAGNYTLTSRLRVDDFAANASTTGVLLAGGPAVQGNIDYRYDADRVRMSMLAGQVYEVKLSGAAADMEKMTLELVGQAGAAGPQWSTRGGDGSITLGFKPVAGGDYYYEVEGFFLGGTGLGTSPYTLNALPAQLDDFSDSKAGAARIDVGTAVAGSLHAGIDVDYMAIELVAGTTYALDMSAAGASLLLAAGISGPGATAFGPAPGYTFGNYTFTAASTGTYYLGVNQGLYSSPLQPYSAKISVATDDRGASAATAGSLDVGGAAVSGYLERGGGDRDWFGIDLSAGKTYWFGFTGERVGRGDQTFAATTPLVAMLKVIDASGTVLASTPVQDYVRSQTLPFVPASDGKYYLDVSDPTGYFGSYRVTAAFGQPDDYGITPADAGVLVNAATVSGRLELPTDRDSFKLSAVAGETYVIVTKPVLVGNGASSTYYGSFKVSATAPGGAEIYLSSERAAGNEIYQHFLATSTGDYILTASQSTDGHTHSYTMRAHSVGPDLPDNTLSTGVLQENSVLAGRIDHLGDADWVKLTLVAGNSYVFELLGSRTGAGSLNTSYNFYFDLASASGASLSSSKVPGSAEPTLRYTATASGDYFLTVRPPDYLEGSYVLKSTNITQDQAGPVVVGGAHMPGATGVALADDIVLRFNEPIRVAEGISLRDSNGNNVGLPGTHWIRETSTSDYVLSLDPYNLLRPGMTYTLDITGGKVIDLAGNNFMQAHSYTFSTVPTVAVGGAGNDYLSGAGTSVRIDGGAGRDTVFYPTGAFGIQATGANGEVTVKAFIAGAPVTDVLVGIERVIFSDTWARAYDADGVAGQAYRLYRAAFDRQPDAAGVGYWMSMMDQGVSLEAVARGFVDSAEFKALYGATSSDETFIARLYANVLHRPLDQGGADYWSQALGNGFTRAQVLAYFSESAENQAAVISLIGNGFDYQPHQ